MGKTNDEHLAKLNTTGIAWDDMTDAQKLALRKEWIRLSVTLMNSTAPAPERAAGTTTTACSA